MSTVAACSGVADKPRSDELRVLSTGRRVSKCLYA